MDSFLIGKYEVTQEEYEDLMGENPSRFVRERNPVEQVNWYEAVLFCNALSAQEGLPPAYRIDKGGRDAGNRNTHDLFGYLVEWDKGSTGCRLPTEAEWEYACRAGTNTSYSTGCRIDALQANFCDWYRVKFRRKTTPVDWFPPNPWGICDMHGNVFEWCWDWFDDGAAADGVRSTPPYGTERVIRGGSWRRQRDELRSDFRTGLNPCRRYFESVGFRVVRSCFG